MDRGDAEHEDGFIRIVCRLWQTTGGAAQMTRAKLGMTLGMAEDVERGAAELDAEKPIVDGAPDKLRDDAVTAGQPEHATNAELDELDAKRDALLKAVKSTILSDFKATFQSPEQLPLAKKTKSNSLLLMPSKEK